MLLIRSEQMNALKRASFRRFVDRMVEHLKRFTPRHFNILSDDEIREVIQNGWELARRHDYNSERSVRLYIELMFMLGSSFYTDPQFPWISEIVDGNSKLDESERIDIINKKAWDVVDHATLDYADSKGRVDPNRFIEQLQKLHNGLDQLASTSTGSGLKRDIKQLLQQLFPHKCG